jgi:two-component system, LytTR family, response regulator
VAEPAAAAAAPTLRAVVVDDEPLAREGVRGLLARHADVVVVGEAADGIGAVELLLRERPDFVLLDVQMPGCDGLEVLRRLPPDTLPAVVFVTAHDRYAIAAFDAHALDYLLKPFDDERFHAAIERVKGQLRRQRASELAERLVALLANRRAAPTPSPVEHLSIPGPDRTLLLPIGDIDWIEAADYYSRVHAGGKSHLLRESLNSLHQRLDGGDGGGGGGGRFVRIHRSVLVARAKVRELLHHGRDREVVLTDGTRLRVARSYLAKLPW